MTTYELWRLEAPTPEHPTGRWLQDSLHDTLGQAIDAGRAFGDETYWLARGPDGWLENWLRGKELRVERCTRCLRAVPLGYVELDGKPVCLLCRVRELEPYAADHQALVEIDAAWGAWMDEAQQLRDRLTLEVPEPMQVLSLHADTLIRIGRALGRLP